MCYEFHQVLHRLCRAQDGDKADPAEAAEPAGGPGEDEVPAAETPVSACGVL